MNFKYNERDHVWEEQNITQNNFNNIWKKSNNKKTVVILVCLVCMILFCLFGFAASENAVTANNTDTSTLKLVVILFRHGARSPTGTYKSDPYKNYNWSGGFGVLTNEGKLQMYNLGKTFRKRYQGYLPDYYLDESLSVRCSEKSRTLMSAYTLLAGLYPPQANETWNGNITWQPIPVYTIPRNLDMLLTATKQCPMYDKHFDEILKSPEILKIKSDYKELFTNLTLHCNETINTLLQIEHLYSHLLIQKNNGLTLPTWTNGIFPEKMESIPGLSLALYTYDDFMIRIRGGPLLEDIIKNMKAKISGKTYPNRKMYLYSGHDLTIVNLRRTLMFTDNILPDFGASLVIELHSIKNSTEYEIKIFYYESYATEVPSELQMPLCGTPCKFDNFLNITDKHISKNWNEECAINEIVQNITNI